MANCIWRRLRGSKPRLSQFAKQIVLFFLCFQDKNDWGREGKGREERVGPAVLAIQPVHSWDRSDLPLLFALLHLCLMLLFSISLPLLPSVLVFASVSLSLSVCL